MIARQSFGLAFSVSGAWTLNIKHSRIYCNCLLLSDKDHRLKYRSTGLSLNAWMHRDEHGELVFLWASAWCKNPVSCICLNQSFLFTHASLKRTLQKIIQYLFISFQKIATVENRIQWVYTLWILFSSVLYNCYLSNCTTEHKWDLAKKLRQTVWHQQPFITYCTVYIDFIKDFCHNWRLWLDNQLYLILTPSLIHKIEVQNPYKLLCHCWNERGNLLKTNWFIFHSW